MLDTHVTINSFCFVLCFAASFNDKREEFGCDFCRFCDLSAVLEPGRPVRTDKPSILDDAIRVLSQLKTEAEELKTRNEKLLEEIKCLKVSIVSDIYCSELNISFLLLSAFWISFL